MLRKEATTVAISKRDTKIIYAMMFMALAYILWLFGIQPVYQNYVDLMTDLDRQQTQFEKNRKTLAEAKKIEEGYKRVEAQFPQDVPDKDPADVFSEEVNDLVNNVVHKTPEIRPAVSEKIKGATGYEMLSFPIALKDVELKPIVDLLKAFDQRGYLVLSATLTRPANLDKSNLDLVEITLARIVKPEEPQEPVRPIRPGLLHPGAASAARRPAV